ncbi:MAG: hypothetical protein NVS1B14_13110 [Vulcanimicrobiaceae bacterium]
MSAPLKAPEFCYLGFDDFSDAELRDLKRYIDAILFNRACEAESMTLRTDAWGVIA